jgi:transcriptional regulator with XRE-family HTH domain
MKKKPDNIAIQLGRKLRKLRKERGLTQAELAKLSGVGDKYLQDLEGKNPRNANLLTVQKLAKGLDISVSELINFDEKE